MNPHRRRIVATLAFSLAGAPALAQNKRPVEGTDYRLITPPLPPESKTKVEVLEFFWYGCPHCFAFEPILSPWVKKLPPDVIFKRVPTIFNDSWVPHARLYYALELLGETERLHKLIFDTIHEQHQMLVTQAAITEFMEKNGVDKKKFSDAYNSFSLQNKVQRSLLLQNEYKIDGVPAMGVDGRYATSNTMLGGDHRAVLPVLDYLIILARKQHKLPLPKA